MYNGNSIPADINLKLQVVLVAVFHYNRYLRRLYFLLVKTHYLFIFCTKNLV